MFGRGKTHQCQKRRNLANRQPRSQEPMEGQNISMQKRRNLANRAFSHDVTAAMLVFKDNKTVAMLLYQANPVGVQLFSYVNTLFCSNELHCCWSRE